MKVADLVKYKRRPHIYMQHMLGLVTAHDDRAYQSLHGVYVVWTHDRNRGPAGTVMYEYVDELEVVK